MLQNISNSNKHCSFELYIHQRILKKMFIIVLSSTAVFSIDNNNKCLLSTKPSY